MDPISQRCLRLVGEKSFYLSSQDFSVWVNEGVADAAATVDQRLIENPVGDGNLMYVLLYLDYLPAFARTLAERSKLKVKHNILYRVTKTESLKHITEWLGWFGIHKSRTSSYHPQDDPQPERFTVLSWLCWGPLVSTPRPCGGHTPTGGRRTFDQHLLCGRWLLS